MQDHASPLQYRWIAFPLLVATLLLYLNTLAPGMLRGDSGEFQWAMATLNIPHATGYPLFILLGHFWGALLPIGSEAYRLNLLSPLFGALAVTVLFVFGLELGNGLVASLAGGVALAVAPIFWFNASILEVYTLNALFLSLSLYLAWGWAQHGVPLYLLFIVLGLALAHHRMMVLALPGLAIYLLATNWRHVLAPGRIMLFVLCLIPGLALYLFVPLRLVAAGSTWEFAWNDIILGRQFAASLFREFQPVQVLVQFPWNSLRLLLPVTLWGAFASWRQDRRLSVMLFFVLATDLLFGLAYWVPDVEVFLTPALVVLCLWLSFGLADILRRVGAGSYRLLNRTSILAAAIALAGLVLSLWPVMGIRDIQSAVSLETDEVENKARALLSAPLPTGALLELDWETATAMRFLQSTESLRTDLEIRLIHIDRRSEYLDILENVRSGRPVLLDPGIQPVRFTDGYRWTRDALGLVRLEPGSSEWIPVQEPISAQLQLVGYRSTPQSGALLWSSHAHLSEDYATYVHLFDVKGQAVGQQDHAGCCEPVYGYATSQWDPGWRIADYFKPWPVDTTYVRLGLYANHAGDLEPYGNTIYLQVRPAGLEGMKHASDAGLGELAALRGWTIRRVQDQVTLDLYWECHAKTSTDYALIVYALDSEARIVSQFDRQPLDGVFPTHAWQPGQIVQDTAILEHAGAAVRLQVGLYDPETGARLPVADGAGDSIELPLD